MPNPDDELTFSIGAREIYDKIVAVAAGVESLQRDRDADRADHNALKRDVSDLGHDVRALQRFRWQAGGALALTLAEAAYIIPHL